MSTHWFCIFNKANLFLKITSTYDPIQDIYPYWKTTVPPSLPDVFLPLHEAPLLVSAGNKTFRIIYEHNYINNNL